MFENILSTFSPWSLLSDLGIICALLLIGKLLRAKVKFIQKLFIPPCVLAGFLGLAFGPNGLGWLPLSSQLSTYAAILIALVFGSIPLSSPKYNKKDIKERIGPMWIYSQFGMIFQWGIAGLFGILVLKFIWPQINTAFGILLPTGFYGGYGTATAIGTAFDGLGWNEALSLGMTTATAGMVTSILGGLIILKRGIKRGHTNYVKDFKDLPQELRSGLLPPDKRESLGETTTSSMSIESLTYHISMLFIIAFGGYLISQGVKSFYPKLELPVFSCAFLVGLLLKTILDATKASKYTCQKTVSSLGGMFTDLLVAFGIAAIRIEIVVKYALPLIVLIVCGIFFIYWYTFYFGKRLFKEDWFEKSIFCWGFLAGNMSSGIALLRIADPKMQSKALDDYGMAYLTIAPIEILIVTFVPMLFINGFGLWFSIGCILISLLLLFVAKKLGWWYKK